MQFLPARLCPGAFFANTPGGAWLHAGAAVFYPFQPTAPVRISGLLHLPNISANTFSGALE